MGIYNASGQIRLTASPGSGFCGLYAPDGSLYYTIAPGSGFCGIIAPDGSLYVVDATGSTSFEYYDSNGAIRVTTNLNEQNGALKVTGLSGISISNGVLMEDGTYFILLEDNSSYLLLEA